MSDLTVLSLGAGVQSSCLLLMACAGVLPRPNLVLFADTGWEPARVYAHLKYLGDRAAEAGLTLEVVRASTNIREEHVRPQPDTGRRLLTMPLYARNASGDVAPLRRQCTKEYKICPVRRRARAEMEAAGTWGKGRTCELWMGISMDEIGRMSTADVKWMQHRYPLIERRMDRNACLAWLAAAGHPEPPKSSCVGCVFHSDRTWLEMKERYPDEFQDAVEVDRAVRSHAGVRGQMFLHRSGVPLEEIDFAARLALRAGRIPGQMSLFGEEDGAEECTGVCFT